MLVLCIELSGIVFNVSGEKKNDFSPTIFWEISDEKLAAIDTH